MNLNILLIGDAERAEFRGAAESLAAAGTVARAGGPDAGAERIARQELLPDLIVVTASYPGEFAAEAIERLRRAVPLARIVALLGSWCEGEMRSGHPWPGVVRIYAHQWLPRFARELAQQAQGRGGWSLPVTTTDEERLLATAASGRLARPGLAAVHTAQPAMADFLMAACRGRGYAAVWLEPARPACVEGVVAVLFDATELGTVEEAALRRLAQPPAAAATTPIIALLDFPRMADRQRAVAAGATAVLAKPFLIDDLWEAMEEMRNAEC